MLTPRDPIDVFTVEEGFLVRRVVPVRGTPYQHRCPLDAYTQVAHEVAALGRAAPFTLVSLQGRLDRPATQVAVALAFLKERSVVVPVHGRRYVAASDFAFEDAMIEYHALEHITQGGATDGA